MLYSLDDPVISRHDFFKIPPKKNFDVLITKKGGHVAWLGYTQTVGRFRWMDNTIVKWVTWFDTQNNTTQ
jgi:predicted alpha/beta-fold hydrolase